MTTTPDPVREARMTLVVSAERILAEVERQTKEHQHSSARFRRQGGRDCAGCRAVHLAEKRRAQRQRRASDEADYHRYACPCVSCQAARITT